MSILNVMAIHEFLKHFPQNHKHKPHGDTIGKVMGMHH